GMNMPRTLAGRSIVIKLWPKKPDERQNFEHQDDEEFAILRRKLARWAADNAAAIKQRKPLLPARFNNRLAENWKLLLAIAELLVAIGRRRPARLPNALHAPPASRASA